MYEFESDERKSSCVSRVRVERGRERRYLEQRIENLLKCFVLYLYSELHTNMENDAGFNENTFVYKIKRNLQFLYK